MKLKPVVVALSLMAGVSAASATTIFDAGPYTLSYDETTTFGFLASSFSSSGNSYGFSWNFSPDASVVSFGSTEVKFVTLPSFTLTPNAGYTLSGGFNAFLGNLVYTEVGGATTGILAYGDVSVNGGAPININGHLVSWTQTLSVPGSNSGYFAESATLPLGSFTSIAVSNASLALSASGGIYSSIIAQPQNKIEFSFTAVPVPEPETYAMLLAGLGVMGAIARRRRTIQK
ncbi:MAG: PEP-CTERM sorting domain-containing protein [Propionivibrio sp.]|uniref:PEP-CTERM sorting domain-containing protein n=1 Tax=Propionivibrio sp. TaxID=2212460 RepID=UPI001A47A853|nr:PEP-CTERM sorting domain-containing protein [Propionivibrio sp.]MBL8414116.1 PEP-CTERM sorting domain-containing protein [Propionivibrio sp.]